MENKDKKGVTSVAKKNIIINCIIVAIALILVVCAVIIAIKVIGYKKAKETYGEVSGEVNDIIENNKDETSKDSWTRPDGWVGMIPDEDKDPDTGADPENPGTTPENPGEGTGTDTNPENPGTGSSGTGSTPDVPGSSEGEDDKEQEIVHSQLYLEMKGVLDKLTAVNPEVYGYIQVEISNSKGIYKISYPIMRSKSDDTYYLDHLYNGEKNDSGSIFVISYVSDKVEDNQNIALFGHNMQNGTMFNKITEILRHEEAFFGVKGKDNYYTDITVFTYDGIYKFDVFAAYTTKSSNNYCQAYFNGDDDFVSFCDRIQDDSKWSKDYTFVPSDVILTFSTCTNNLIGDDRIAVHALLVSISQ